MQQWLLFTFSLQSILWRISLVKKGLCWPWGYCEGIYMLPYNHRGHDLLKKSIVPTVGTGQVISSTNGSGGSAGIEGLILSPLLVVWEKSMADLEKALRHTVNGILYCWKLSPTLLLPHPSTRRRRSINNFRRTWAVGGLGGQKKTIHTILKKIRVDLGKVKPEFLAARLFHKQAKAEAIICEGRRELLAPVRFDFSGRNWISSH